MAEVVKGVSVKDDGLPGDAGKRAGGINVFSFLFTYLREVIVEAKRVRWPTRSETFRYTLIVVGICVVLFLLTFGFDWLVTRGFYLLGIGRQG